MNTLQQLMEETRKSIRASIRRDREAALRIHHSRAWCVLESDADTTRLDQLIRRYQDV